MSIWSRRLLVVAVSIALVLGVLGGLALLSPSSPETASSNLTSVDQVHAQGVTGSNVTVGIVDVTGFDTEHPQLQNNITAARAFAPGETVANGGVNDHGTAVASLVAATAPDSDMYLGTFDTVSEFEAAVNWMRQEDVDIILVPSTFYGRFSGLDPTVRTAIEGATNDGIVVVAPTGNLGRGHWEGQYRPTENGVHQFEDGTQNVLTGDNRTTLRLWLSWNRSHRNEDYTVELFRTNGTRSQLVARSQPYQSDEVPNERLVTALDNGTYYFRITGPNNATGAHLRVESPTHTLGFRTRSRSITSPATAPEALSVGAYDRETERVRPFSSAGPTQDGRVGVDIVAPDGFAAAAKPDGFRGSSASAAYVAGVVALMLDAGPIEQPETVERLLEESASDLRKNGVDTVSGYGVVRPVEAVQQARNHSNPR